MSNSQTKATNSYSQSLFELAKENSVLDEIEVQAKSLYSVIKDSQDFSTFIKDPTFIHPSLKGYYVWESGWEGEPDPQDGKVKLGVQLTPLEEVIKNNKGNFHFIRIHLLSPASSKGEKPSCPHTLHPTHEEDPDSKNQKEWTPVDEQV